MRNVNPNPAAIQALRDGNSGAATTERVEDGVTFVRACTNDAFEESFWLLCWIAEALSGF
jgi:hypothetical protein